MSSSIHYRVKAGGLGAPAPAWQSIHFDGVYLSCLELKRRIIYSEKWLTRPEDATFDLLLSNSQNAEDYRDEGYSIHRNGSIIVKKVPPSSTGLAEKLFIPPGSLGEDWNISTSTWTPHGPNGAGDANLTPLGKPGGGGEEEGFAAMQSAASKYSGAPGRGGFGGAGGRNTGPFQQSFSSRTLTATSRPPTGYTCHRCKLGGHYIQ
jgi:hypothetical protein